MERICKIERYCRKESEKMQAEYIKEWTETYLQVFPEHMSAETYIEHMLKYQPGIGRLEFSKEFQDGYECYRYKVSGRKALSVVYAALPMKEEQIRNLLQQLIDILEDAKECLLAEEDFLLEPSYMFLSLPQFMLGLCYVPGYGKELNKQLEGLFEYMLNRVDYEDKAAVELLYDCYTICMKNKEGLEALKKRLGKKDSSFSESVKIQESFVKEALPFYTGTLAGEKAKSETQSYLSWIKEKLMIRRRKREEIIPQICEKKTEVSQVYEEQGGENGEEDVSRTVLLAVRSRQEQPQLIHEQTGEVIVLKTFPFYLGRGKEYVSYAIERDGISRLHFCIRERESQYYLSDLNSTNGTYINGAEILPGREHKIVSQDRIRAGVEEFLFSLG